MYRILVVTQDPFELHSLRRKAADFNVSHLDALPHQLPSGDIVLVLVDYRFLDSSGELPDWARHTPIVVYGAPATIGDDSAAIPNVHSVTPQPLRELDPLSFIAFVKRHEVLETAADSLVTALTRLDRFSRRLMAVDSTGSFKQRLPLHLSTLLHFDGMAIWDWSSEELQLFCPAEWQAVQLNELTAQVRDILMRRHERQTLPPTTTRIAFALLGHQATPGPVQYHLSAQVGLSEGLLFLFRTAPPEFSAHEQRLFELAANLVDYALRNARMFDSLEAQSRKIIEKNRELLKASRLKTNFIANTSHELKTPLHAILGLAELLPLAESPTELAHMSERIDKNAHRLLDIVNDILDYSRLVVDDVRVYAGTFSVDDFLKEVVDSVIDLAKVKGLHLQAVNSSGRSTINTDREKLFDILINLLTNAIKFTPTGSVDLEVRSDGEWLQIVVQDTGIGIPATEQEKIFDEFHRVKGPLQEATEGTGLGLTIAQSLVELLGGKITVQSTLQKGSTFTVTLPTAPQPHMQQTTLALPHLNGGANS